MCVFSSDVFSGDSCRTSDVCLQEAGPTVGVDPPVLRLGDPTGVIVYSWKLLIMLHVV